MNETRLIRCTVCAAKNRVPEEKLRLGLSPVCGRCKTPLSLGRAPITVTDATFAAEVEQSPLTVLVDFWAPWCGPCRLIGPMIEQLAGEMGDRVRFAKINVDDNPSTAARFRVEGIPTLVILKQGREVDRLVGALPKEEIVRRLERATG